MSRPLAVLKFASIAAIGVALSGCFDFDPFGPDTDWGNCGSSCAPIPTVNPWSANILKGDTVRFVACSDYSKCFSNRDTGNVLANWSVSSATVVELGAASAITVLSRTSVLVRGMARGRAQLKVTFASAGGTVDHPVNVADTSDIKSIELPYYYGRDTLRVNIPRQFGVHLRDVGGTVYRGTPSSYYSSDTTIIQLSKSTFSIYDQSYVLDVVGKKPGKASFTVTFNGLTATREVTVIP